MASEIEAFLGARDGIHRFHAYVERRPVVISMEIYADDIPGTDEALREVFGEHASIIDLTFERWPTSSIGLESCTVDASGLHITADGMTGTMHRDPRLEIEERDDAVEVRLMCEKAGPSKQSSWTTGSSSMESAFALVGYTFHETARLTRPLGGRELVWLRDRG